MNWIKRSGVILGASIALALGIASGASAQNDHTFSGPGSMKKGKMVTGTNSTFNPIKEVRGLTAPFVPNDHEDESIVPSPAPDGFYPNGTTRDLAGVIGTESLPTTKENFAGIPYTGWIPPDPQVAAGPFNTVSVTNSHFAIHGRDGTPIYQNSFATFMNAPSWFFFDPKVMYDPWANRFCILVLGMQQDANDFVLNENYVLLYSDDSNATGSWGWKWLDAKVNGGTYVNDHWVDYPYLGVTSGGIAVSGIKFPQGSGSGSYSHLRFLRSAEVYGSGGVSWWDYAGFSSDGSPDYRVVPARQTWQNGNFYCANTKEGGSNTVTIRRFQNFTFTGGGPTYDTTVKTVNAYVNPPNAIQQGNANRLEVIDCRTLDCTFSNQQLWITHQTATDWGDGAGNRCSIKVNKFNVSLTTLVDETFGNTGFDYYYPSLASNLDGDAMVSFARSSATEYASVRTAGYMDGQTTFGGSGLIKAGESGYYSTFGTGRNRWGDYFGVGLDGWDLRSFYGVGQYAKTSTTWNCQIWRSNFKPSHVVAVAAASGPLTGTATLNATVTRSDTSAVVAGVSVTFSISGVVVGSDTTNASGVATFVYSIPLQNPTTRTISCTVNESSTLNEDTGTGVLTITKANSAIQVASEAGALGQTISLLAQLKRIPDDQLLSGKTVSFTVNGVAAGSDTTDASGFATINYTIVNGPGAYSIVATFAGDTQHNSDSASSTLTVSKGATTLAVNSPSGQRTTSIQFSTTLRRSSDNLGLSGKSISWVIDGGAPVISATNASGVAVLNYVIPAGATLGSGHTVACTFVTDATYLGSTDSGSWTVLGPSFNGNVSFLDWIASDAGQTIAVTVRNAANAIVQGPTNVVTTTGGNWKLYTTLPIATYKVSVKGSHWLRQQKTNISLPNTTTGTAVFTHDLRNGDAINDNVVDLSDYTVIVTQFNTVGPGGDMNGDGIVDLTDYTIVITNFNLVGDL
ncbi:MAG: Ig-like domain repeat protein [Armatimonadetes bacterium]|nr:Ig-like domain repeat protein [Armatimonadota bacterium]